MEGFATTQASWNPGVTRLVNPPRATAGNLERGATLGKPGDTVQQRRVLLAALELLSQDAPVSLVKLDESEAP